MNERLKELAEQAGLMCTEDVNADGLVLWFKKFDLERFAELVRQDEANGMRETYMKMIHGAIADEREDCARTCDDMSEGLVGDDVSGADGAGYCANAIRARMAK